MSHEVLITRRQSIFIFFCKSRQRRASASQPASTGQHRPSEARLCLDLQRNKKNALSSGYQDLMGHLILTTSPWSVLIWITLSFTVQKPKIVVKHWILLRARYNTCQACHVTYQCKISSIKGCPTNQKLDRLRFWLKFLSFSLHEKG